MNLELINVIFHNLELEQGAVIATIYLEQVHDCTRKLFKKQYCIWRQYKELECTLNRCKVFHLPGSCTRSCIVPGNDTRGCTIPGNGTRS
jgi:hypothetical protein